MSFLDYCREAGITPEAHLALSQDPRDLVPQPDMDAVVIGHSGIHGRGVYPSHWFGMGDRIGLLVDSQFRRTEKIGRWINHSDKPNTRMCCAQGEGIYLRASEPIFTEDEIFIDYRDTLLLRKIMTEHGIA